MSAPKDWRAMTHDELYAAVQAGAGPGASVLAESRWQDLMTVITDAEVRMHAAVARTAEEWAGSGGDAARSGLHTLNSWVLGAATDAQTTLAALAAQRESAGELRTLMPPPNTEQVVAAGGEVDAHPGNADKEWALVDARAAAAEDARRVMEQYHFVSVETRQTIDFWTTPPTVVVEAAPPGTGTGPAGGSGLPEFGAGSGGPAALSGVDGSGPGPGTPGGVGPVVASLPVGGGPEAGGNVGGAGAGGVGANGGGGAGGGPGPVGSGVAGSGGVVGGGSGAGGAIVGGGGPAVAGSPAWNPPRGGPGAAGATPISTPGGATPALSRDTLPPGAGGRGPRNVLGGTGPSSGVTGPRGLLPGVPTGVGPPTSWRDVVAGLRGGGPGGVTDPPAGPRGGGAPRAEMVRAAVTVPSAPETARGGIGHGF